MKWLQKILSKYMQRGLSESERMPIIKGTFQSFIIQGISVALVFLGNLLLARWAGASSYGKYVHLFNWISILSVIALGGREDLTIVQLTKYLKDGRPGLITPFILRANKDIFITSLISAGLFLCFVFLVPVKAFYEYRAEFVVASIAVYFTSFLTLNQLALQTLNHVRLSQVVERLIKPSLLILFFVFAHWLVLSFTARTLVFIADLALFFSCLILAWLLFRTAIRKYRFHAGQALPPENLLKKTFYFFSITLLSLLSTKIVMLVMPYFTPQRDIGIFNVSYRIADLIIYPYFLMHAILPQLFARHQDSEVSYKQSLYSESTRLMLIISLPILVVNLLAGRFFLGWFGNYFVEGYTGLVYLSIAQLLFSFFGPANTILMMQNREKYSAICQIVYVAVMFVGSLWLIPVFGITGGAVSVLISSLIYNVLLAVITYRVSGIISPFLLFLVPRRSDAGAR
jgi:O-antigen/teichoic acid export membrane protein